MKKHLALFFCIISLSINAQSSYCTPTDMPVEVFTPNSTTTPTANIGLQYLCGPNTVVYDTIGPQHCREVYINNNSSLYLLAGCPATDFIWVKNGCTLNIKSGSVGIIEIVAEPGAIINHPPMPHSYTSYTIACTSITYPNINCTTGLEDIESVTLKVYPNPVNSIIHIKLTQNNATKNSYRITLMDMIGKEIVNETYKEELDISHLEKGIYVLSLYQNGSLLAARKIIKE
jgi:hypothetical protein